MNTDRKLTIYKASAGSGKTFRLAISYIAMLIHDPQSYSSILAVTFTNKATAEMKRRILSQLYGIGHGLASSKSYYEEIRRLNPTLTEQTIRHNAILALDNILQDYGHFRVETIDSFFQGVLRGLARELQLGNGLAVELDTEKVISDAVTDFLATLEPKSQDMANVTRFIMGNIEKDANWNIDSSLKKFSKELFSEIFMQKGEKLKEILSRPDAIADYQANLIKARDAVLTELKQTIQEAGKDILNSITAAGYDIDIFSSNIQKAIIGIESGDIVEKGLGKTITNACADPEAFYTKPTLKKYPSLRTLAAEHLCQCLQKVVDTYNDFSFYKNSYSSALKYLYELSLLLSIRTHIDSQNQELGRFVLADTPKLLAELKQGDTSFVFEKTGSFTDHIMIDEFQDTSGLQWNNLYLLLLECLSRGKECLVVGDVKQSIYRWRNSDWNILNTGIEEKLGQYSKVETMSDNYRSQQAVIDFNNKLFPAIEKYIQEYNSSVTGSEFPALGKAYADVCQNCTKKSTQGFVSMNMINSDLKGQDLTDDLCQRLSDCLDRLLEAGVKQTDIAMLFRYGKEISTVAAWFAANRPDIRMISSEAFQLDSSVPVRILINALRWISDRKDKVALANMIWEWKKYVLKADVSIQDTVHDMEEQLPASLAGKWELLRQIPIYELIEKLYTDLELSRITDQDQYVLTLLDIVSDWLRRNPGDIQVFLADWDDSLHTKTIPATQADGIRLVTIHKSKGLEFHTVIIPFCDWGITKSGDKLWVEPDKEPFDKIPLLPVSFEASLQASVFQDSYTEEAGQQTVDNMNLLYVAFTRAAGNLIAFARNHNSKGNCVCNILESSLIDAFGCKSEDGIITYENGTIYPHQENKGGSSDNPFDAEMVSQDISMQSYPMNAQFRQSGESVRFTQAAQDSTDNQEEYINRGKMLHDLFSRIKTLADIDTQVDALFGNGLIDSQQQADDLKHAIHEHIEKSGVASWFDGNYRLFNETSILFRDNGVMQTRRPDRVMIMPDGSAVVVDFKFGTEREDYHHQVQEYMELLRKMGFQNVEGHIWYVYNNKLTHI